MLQLPVTTMPAPAEHCPRTLRAAHVSTGGAEGRRQSSLIERLLARAQDAQDTSTQHLSQHLDQLDAGRVSTVRHAAPAGRHGRLRVQVQITVRVADERRPRHPDADAAKLMRRALILLPVLLLLVGCRTSLFEGLDEDQANRIIAALSHHGINGYKERNADRPGTFRSTTPTRWSPPNWPARMRCRAAATRISANCSAARG